MENPFLTRLYAFGSNGSGQLGVGHTDDSSEPQPCMFQTVPRNQNGISKETTPTHFLQDTNIVRIVAGGNHTLLLTDNGTVYAAGDNSDGRCGYTPSSGLGCTFVQVEMPVEGAFVTDVAATWEASFFVLDQRRIFTCGSGIKGELGLGEDVTNSVVMRLVFDMKPSERQQDDDKIVSITASMGHVLVRLSGGSVYGWGNCRKGQLGSRLKDAKICWRPSKIDLPNLASQSVSGRDYSLVQDQKSGHELLGETASLVGIPETLDTSNCIILAGWTHLYTWRKGKVVGFGRNNRGQLPPNNLPWVDFFAVGSEHCIAVLYNRHVVAWGWGEHGNCGQPLDAKSCVNGRFNKIVLNLSKMQCPAGVGAGCATSFVWTHE